MKPTLTALTVIGLTVCAVPALPSWTFQEDFDLSGFTQSWTPSSSPGQFPSALTARYVGGPRGTFEYVDGAMCFRMANTLNDPPINSVTR
jgi:hypothetical protein